MHLSEGATSRAHTGFKYFLIVPNPGAEPGTKQNVLTNLCLCAYHLAPIQKPMLTIAGAAGFEPELSPFTG